MCLTIDRHPFNRPEFLINAGYKWLEKRCINGNDIYVTPYRQYFVHSNGWILPEEKILINSTYNAKVAHGAVHYYNYYTELRPLFQCYAFGVIGHETYSSAAYAMYVKLPDHTDDIEQTIKMMMKGHRAHEHLTLGELLSFLPKLEPMRHIFQSHLETNRWLK